MQNMKRLIVFVVAVLSTIALNAQTPQTSEQESKNEFTNVIDLPATPVKDQSSSGTCWSFSGVGFLESELLRTGKGEFDLSEMWIVRNTYFDKAVKYVRMHGKGEFGGGGATHDVFNVIVKYGIVPDEVYTGLNYGTDKHRHGELDAVMQAYVDAVVKNPNRTLSTAWQAGINGILDAYLGPIPEKFTYNGVEYTPKSFAASLGLDMTDYVSFTSFTHHPFGTRFAVEVPDNWAWGLSCNIPLEQMMSLIDTSLEKGYTVEWASDVSETGFLYSKGYAVVPDMDNTDNMDDTEKAKWVKMTPKERQSRITTQSLPVAELKITQQMRQQAYDNYQTTDDHGMLIVGLAKDSAGNKFYKIKNSWGTSNPFDGYFYASEAFVAYKTLNIVVNKAVLPKELKKSFDIK